MGAKPHRKFATLPEWHAPGRRSQWSSSMAAGSGSGPSGAAGSPPGVASRRPWIVRKGHGCAAADVDVTDDAGSLQPLAQATKEILDPGAIEQWLGSRHVALSSSGQRRSPGCGRRREHAPGRRTTTLSRLQLGEKFRVHLRPQRQLDSPLHHRTSAHRSIRDRGVEPDRGSMSDQYGRRTAGCDGSEGTPEERSAGAFVDAAVPR